MEATGEPRVGSRWLGAHAVDLVVAGLAVTWLWYVLRITDGFSFWSDDLRVIEQSGSLDRWLDPYNNHLSLVPVAADRFLAELAGLSYGPYIVFGALAFLAVPASYYLTTRRAFGPALAAVLAVPLLWSEGMVTRPASGSHYLAVVGAIVAAAALNRGPRADWVLGLALVFSLSSAGGGLVVVGACLVHDLLTRPPVRRWVVTVVPLALWVAWWLLIADSASADPRDPLSVGETARVVRDLCLAPFYMAGLHRTVLAVALMVGFAWWGVTQLLRGLREGANFLAWTAAMVGWALALVQSRGATADAQTFRYAYVSLAFALLAIVPRRPIQGPLARLGEDWKWVAAVGAVVLVAFVSAANARPELQTFASRNDALGREAKGTLLVLSVEPNLIPGNERITFFGFDEPHGTARRLRALAARYGSPYEATLDDIDQQLVDEGVVRHRAAGRRPFDGCTALTEPLTEPGLVTRGLGDPPEGALIEGEVPPLKLWSAEPFEVEIRRFGEEWVPLAQVKGGRSVEVLLPRLNTDVPWQVRADGACDVRE